MKLFNYKLVIASLVAVCSIFIASCDDVLEPKVYSELTPETFFNSEDDFNQALVSIYSPFSLDWGNLYNADPSQYFGQNMLTTEELHSQWWDVFTHFSWGPSTGQFDNTFNRVRTVASATDIIHQLETSDVVMPDEVRARYIAEAKALRGWLNHILYDMFGPVPVRMQEEVLYDLEIDARPSEEEFLGYIIDDLTDAIPDLADNYHGNMEGWGRMSKGAARMVLLRTYMNTHQWNLAEDIAREIVDMGIYQLQDDYYSVFVDRANLEVIHAIPGSEGAPNWWMPEVLTGNFGRTVDGAPIEFNPNFTGWTVYWMPWSFYDTFDPEDQRLDGILDRYVHTDGSLVDREGTEGSVMQGAIPLKYTELANLNNQGQPIDKPVFRYAEVLLSLAEAINEQNGPTPEAEGYLNEIRERVNLDPLTGLSQADFRDALLRERGHEFYNEGLRRQDLIRHGKFVENAQERGRPAQPHHVRFPIPNWIITQSDGVIEQNPGYN